MTTATATEIALDPELEYEIVNGKSPDTTFMIGQNQRLPDLAFVSNERMPEEDELDGIAPIAPDLAVEVTSPNDVLEKVNSKIEDYFAAGVLQVWLISLRGRTVSIYDSPTRVTILTEHEDLTSETILPGFRCRISEIFGKKRSVKEQPAQ